MIEQPTTLTDAEREVVNVAVDEAETCKCCGDAYGSKHVYAAVERILTDRLAAVQAERDSARDQRDSWKANAEQERKWCGEQQVRAESAEAERDAARAEVEALRERVEALVDESLSRPQPGYVSALALRAALEGDR